MLFCSGEMNQWTCQVEMYPCLSISFLFTFIISLIHMLVIPSFLPFYSLLLLLLPPFLFSPSCATAERVSRKFLPPVFFWLLSFHLFLVFLVTLSVTLAESKKRNLFFCQEEEVWSSSPPHSSTSRPSSSLRLMCASPSHLHLSIKHLCSSFVLEQSCCFNFTDDISTHLNIFLLSSVWFDCYVLGGFVFEANENNSLLWIIMSHLFCC